MRFFEISVATIAASAAVFACVKSQSDDSESSDNAVTTFAKNKPVWKGPKPGDKNKDIDAQGVLKAWRQVRDTFYSVDAKGKPNASLKGYDVNGNEIDFPKTSGGQPNHPTRQEVTQCMGNTVPWWSDLVMHFYCWQPSYAAIRHNVRGCFSYVAREAQGPQPFNKYTGKPDAHYGEKGFEARKLFYPEIYDYCLFQPYDYAKFQATAPNADPKKHVFLPIFDTAEIDKNKTTNNRVGVMRWVDENISDAFKHVMFTWYEPDTYNFEQQQEIINAFYGVELSAKTYKAATNAKGEAIGDAEKCIKKRPRQSMDPTDGTHCSADKNKNMQFQPLDGGGAAYLATIKYMTEQVDTRPYTPSKAP